MNILTNKYAKKFYGLPQIEIIDIECEDVILSSNLNDQGNLDWNDNKKYDGEVWGE